MQTLLFGPEGFLGLMIRLLAQGSGLGGYGRTKYNLPFTGHCPSGLLPRKRAEDRSADVILKSSNASIGSLFFFTYK